ncbi:type VI secretion system contractile sheath large subunit [Burkholderia glumae]|uniref:type VI secretion system contractile sheath large subunit n=1 Tax=Burkholderia glumae TaxID=337 RepID=UPI0025551B30|nr:type VI secretion system contractile sheath large subunit [Burkholderia glumae]
MSESVQNKLLRIRPPRVRITYDVETGGAIEKTELPFIVGILADLKGEREDAEHYPSLKERSMIEIDRDNFDDVMKKIQPRATFTQLKQDDAALKALLVQDGDNALIFPNMEAFEPLKVIKALPSLNDIYVNRGKIRDLQARAETSDPVSKVLDAMIQGAVLGQAAVAAQPAVPDQPEVPAVPAVPADGDKPAVEAVPGKPAVKGTPAVAAKDAVPALQDSAVETALAALADLRKKDVAVPDDLNVTKFAEQFKLFYVASNDDVAKITEARKRGAIAVIDALIAEIDKQLSDAVSSIMHCDSFKTMEATWRGLNYLVMNTETSTTLKLRVFDAQKEELRSDMVKAVEFDQSALFKMIYEAEYGTYGGKPYSLLVGDYAIAKTPQDIEFVTKMAEVAAAAHAPFLAQASTDLFSLANFGELDKPRDLKKIFEGEEYEAWREFRDLEDARYVTLALPRALLRLPYGTPTKRSTTPCDGINFDERIGASGKDDTLYGKDASEPLSYAKPAPDHLLWGNPAYLLAQRITNAFAHYSWTAAIRGEEGGGLVENLPLYTYTSDNGSTELLCPTEISITDRREKELNDLGFISLCHCKGTGKAAFFGGQTTNQPKKYFSDAANANARISALLPYMLAASRFAHYIKVIMRQKIGSFQTRGNVEDYLNSWISNYVLLDDNASQDAKAAYPLREAKVQVSEVPGEPGSYRAVVFLKPHFQLEELTTSIRLVANLPK